MKAVRGFGWLKKPKLVIPVLVVICVAAVLSLVIHNLNAPAVGDVNQTTAAPSTPVDPYGQPGTYNGKYISFKYPAHFKVMVNRFALVKTILEAVNYSSTSLNGETIAVQVQSGSVATSSDVAFRRQNKAIYKETDSQKWVEFTKSDGSEDTFFIEHNGLLASLSASSPNGGLTSEALYVASSLKWL